MPTQHPPTRGAPPGFTLIELLVVVAIIAVLISLLASGVFKYLDVQSQNNTETTLRTVQKVLRQQMEAVDSAADKQPIPPSVTALATNNGQLNNDIWAQKRARVIWKTLRRIQEFPMTYAEVLTSPVLTMQAAGPYSGLINDLPPNPSCAKAIKALKSPTFGPGQSGVAGEAATLLLLSLQQTRGGIKFSGDDLASGAQDTNGDGLKEIVDAWGNPIGFYRFPTGNPQDPNYSYTPAGELDRAAPPGNPRFRNPLDPDGALLDPNWNKPMFWNDKGSGIYWFEKVCHLVHDASGPRAFNTPPVLVSAGKDGLFGFNGELFGPHWLTDANKAQLGDMSVTNLSATNDNIYSFRLRLGARGD
jgi:prepilin-type N-terminal cleavage/methylation domain-containing protein